MDILLIGDGRKQTRPDDEVGSKAANLARMAALGLPVPPAFVLPIDMCARISDRAAGREQEGEQQLDGALREGIAYLESSTGKKFGDRRRPLLVSVRSGAAVSMPGMLETVLDVGCTPEATRGLLRLTGNPGFAWDCRRRFLESFGTSVFGVDPSRFATAILEIMKAAGATSERDLDTEDRERVVAAHEATIADCNAGLPTDAMSALVAAANGVCRSWMSDRARTYRKLQKLEHLKGTAVTVQAMVFGNRGQLSGSGVAFSRDPSTGSSEPVVDFLFDAQGEDVVSGRRTPETEAAFAFRMPAIFAKLKDILALLERHFCDVQDVEFTIEEDRLWVLQARDAKRTPRATLRFAVDFVREGLLTPQEAVHRLEKLDRAALAITRFAEAGKPLAQGTGAADGVAVGRAAFDSAAAQRLAEGGNPVILVRPDTSTADVKGFSVSAGILTAVGGRTSHAALVARHMGKACVVGCRALSVFEETHRAELAGATIQEGDWLSINGGSGEVFLGQQTVLTELPKAELEQLDRWRAGEMVCKLA